MNRRIELGWWVGEPHDDGVEGGRREVRGWDATAEG